MALYSLVNITVPPDDIIAADATRFLPSEDSKQKRDAKFSVRVLPAYDYTCALTRHRMIAIDGTTALDAAHIHQFKCGGTCRPTNGIALSKTAHWLFDRGLSKWEASPASSKPRSAQSPGSRQGCSMNSSTPASWLHCTVCVAC